MKRYLVVSDFDQTLSFNDSGIVLSELLGLSDFAEKVAGLSRLNLVQQGAELAYLLRHDPEFRSVRREHLTEAGKRIRLKRNVGRLAEVLERGIDGYRFEFYVVSAAPEEVIHAALEGILPPSRIMGTRFRYDNQSGEIDSIDRVTAGHGKVTAVETLRLMLGLPRSRVVYVGDGSSDVHVMLHVNRGEGVTIAVSEARDIAQLAKRTVLSEDALSVLVPILEEVVGAGHREIRALLERHGFMIQEWETVRTDWVTIRDDADDARQEVEAVDIPTANAGYVRSSAGTATP